MGIPACEAGNYTENQSPPVLRKTGSEIRQLSQLHPDAVTELRIVHAALKVAFPHARLPGFVHVVSAEPFIVTMYTAEQVQLYVDTCKSDVGAVVHIDCTGSVLSKKTTADDRPVYLYSVVCETATTAMPVMEFISNKHNAATISGQLLNFHADAQKVNGGVTIQPRVVVTDFSYALINSVLLAFNTQSLSAYLDFVYRLLHDGNVTSYELAHFTVLMLCCAHIMKAVSVRVKRSESDANKRRAVMLMFAKLQHCCYLDGARSIYRDICVVLCSTEDSDETRTAYAHLLDGTIDEDDDDDADGTGDGADDAVPAEDNCDEESGTSIRERSQFTTYFHEDLPSFDVPDSDSVPAITNSLYSPDSFAIIRSYTHLWPLWSAALDGDLQRFVDKQPAPTDANCRSNAAVESYFRQLKHGRLGHVSSTGARDLCLRQLGYITGRVNEQRCTGRPAVNKRKRAPAAAAAAAAMDETASATETWKRGYTSKATEDKVRRCFPVKKTSGKQTSKVRVAEPDVKRVSAALYQTQVK